MAQPLARHEEPFTSGIEKAAFRLEQAFGRLEQAVTSASADNHSLKVDREKLNHLLRASEEKIQRLQDVASAVSSRLDHTIAVLEAEGA